MTSSQTAQRSIAELFGRFRPYVEAIKGQFLLNAALVIATPLMTALLLWSFKWLLDDVMVGGNTSLFSSVALLYSAAVAAKIGVEYWGRRVEVEAVETVNLAIRSDLYNHVLSLSPGSLGRTTPGDVLTRLQGDVGKAEYVVYTGPISIIADGAAAIIFVSFLIYLDWRLALLALAALPAIMMVVAHLAPMVRRTSRLARRASAGWMTLAEERLQASSVVQSFGAEAREAENFKQRSHRARRMEVSSAMLQARQTAAVEAIVAITGLAVLALGTSLIASGALTVGALAAFIGAVSSLYSPIRSLAKIAGRFQNAAAGAQRVADLFGQSSLVADRPGARSLDKVRGAISLRDVHFSYPDGQTALRGVSLDVSPGETLALVGQSGSGKTSIARLILRHYDVTRGAVLIDGMDIRDATLASLRAAVAPVFQDALVLSGSMLENIRYGAPHAPVPAIEEAVAAASVDHFAREKGGLQASIGLRGSRLSGGQRQRIALARALLRNAPILLLDEATAGVDSETEELIQDAIDKLHGQRTQIIVAHRLSTVRRADRVILIEDGRVIEVGAPDELLARASRCRELFAAQLQGTEAAA